MSSPLAVSLCTGLSPGAASLKKWPVAVPEECVADPTVVCEPPACSLCLSHRGEGELANLCVTLWLLGADRGCEQETTSVQLSFAPEVCPEISSPLERGK